VDVKKEIVNMGISSVSKQNKRKKKVDVSRRDTTINSTCGEAVGDGVRTRWKIWVSGWKG